MLVKKKLYSFIPGTHHTNTLFCLAETVFTFLVYIYQIETKIFYVFVGFIDFSSCLKLYIFQRIKYIKIRCLFQYAVASSVHSDVEDIFSHKQQTF